MYTYIHIYVHMCMYMCVYIYAYYSLQFIYISIETLSVTVSVEYQLATTQNHLGK